MSKNTKKLLIFSIIIFIIAIGIFAFFQITSTTKNPENTLQNSNNKTNEFIFTDAEGNKLKIDKTSNLGMTIIFWNSDSENSLKTLELVDSYYEMYKDSIDFYIINTNEKHKDIISIVNNCDFSFPVYYNHENTASNFYTIEKLPTLIFIDKQGEMHTINNEIDEDTLTANLDILAENY